MDDDDFALPESPGEEGPINSELSERAMRLIIRLGQPFSALLLAQHGGEYRRIASDDDIIAQVKDVVSVHNMMDVRTLKIFFLYSAAGHFWGRPALGPVLSVRKPSKDNADDDHYDDRDNPSNTQINGEDTFGLAPSKDPARSTYFTTADSCILHVYWSNWGNAKATSREKVMDDLR
ncbi:uncharacterized protein F5891DRAFT_983633 [Suillus fuscotomentosus]|uniref:Uncharacterized protein n=1 Tax=Suillus fuscotomentosus TaxID=1912939 RepID=A0AAD4DY69_9AGAM|nr:uncharacterized protein F5891DRAFT_983633 [Suillus fuscotomentosus]KAG1896289.1 hypothetical protein F5891DRAFT_983633 [Suillus fuscotomentosus]